MLPFSTLVKLMESFHPQVGPQGGRPPYGLETMLRIHLMQNWWSLTDDAMEDALIDTGAIRRFAGIHLAQDNIPDATTISAFPHGMDWLLAAATGRDALPGQHLGDFVAVIPLLPNHRGGRRRVLEHPISTSEVALSLT